MSSLRSITAVLAGLVCMITGCFPKQAARPPEPDTSGESIVKEEAAPSPNARIKASVTIELNVQDGRTVSELLKDQQLTHELAFANDVTLVIKDGRHDLRALGVILRNAKKLKILCFGGMEAMPEFPSNSQLTNLDVSVSAIDTSAILYVPAFSVASLPALEFLQVNGVLSRVDGLESCVHLKELRLTHNFPSSWFSDGLPKIPIFERTLKLPSLKVAEFEGYDVSGNNLDIKVPYLERLSLSRCKLGDLELTCKLLEGGLVQDLYLGDSTAEDCSCLGDMLDPALMINVEGALLSKKCHERLTILHTNGHRIKGLQ